MEIILVPVADLLRGSPDIVTPEAGLFATDLPLPMPRDADSRPSVEELIASDTGHVPALRVAETPEEYGTSN